MTDAQWAELQSLVKRSRATSYMTTRDVALAVVLTGILPPSREEGRYVYVHSFTDRDVEYRMVGDRCECPASSEFGRRCSHSWYHALCQQGRHPAKPASHDGVDAAPRDPSGLYWTEW